MRILIVEDDAKLVSALVAVLGDHYVVVAGTVASALRSVAESDEPFDVVLLDIGLPDGTGLDVLRGWPGRRSKVVVMTGRDPGELWHDAVTLGATAFLAKPFSVAQLLDKMSSG